MKLKFAKIIVRSIDDTKKEWKKALKGKKKSIQKDDEIIFTSLDTVAKIFSKTRMQILKAILNEGPKSIYELAKVVGRDFKNVHTDVKLLADIGLIELKETGDSRKGLQPIAKYSGINLDLAA